MSTTRNGYDVIEDADSPRLRLWRIPGTDRHLRLLDGPIGFLLVHLILWFHEVIQPIDRGVWDEWAWSVRPVRGTTDVPSEHGAGVAVDVNATLHPMGKGGTFTLRQQARIRARLTFYKGLIEWGGNFRTRKDEMHFQAARKPRAAFVRLARRLLDSPRGKRILAANPGARKVIAA